MPLTEHTQPYLRPMLSGLGASRIGSQVTIILPGGQRYNFNGAFTPLPQRREVTFQPRRGTINPAPEIESPIRTTPQETRLPARRTLRFGRVTVGGAATAATFIAVGLEYFTQAHMASEAERKLRILQMEFTIPAATAILEQTQAQLQAIRTRIATMTKKKTDRKTSERRTRIHGFSRVRA